MGNDIEEKVKEICMDNFSEILNKLEEIVDTSEVSLTILVEHKDFRTEICG